ncbi:MAG: hypothetical protein R3C39_10130 [Dehalococcoidia bacterium]
MSVLGHLTPPKILTLGAAVAIASLGIAITSSEASGDPYGDSAASTGAITGDAADAAHAADTVFVEVGGAGGGSITVSFDNNIAFDGPGDDLTVHVVADGPVATATLEVSDGTKWVDAGPIVDGTDTGVDLGALELTFASAVRISQPDGASPEGFNLDAVTAINQIGLDELAIDLAPATASLEGNTEHEVVASVTDGGVGVENVPVAFRVISGPNDDEDGNGATDVNGDVPFAWTGDGGPGDDTVEAWLDINGNGTRDGAEPFASATATWNGTTGAIEITDVDGGGLVSGDLVQVTVTDADLDVTDGADTVTVQVFSTSDGTGFPLELTETGAHTGVFTGTFTAGDATDATGLVLATAPGDDVTARYEDELDGTGAAATVEATIAVVETEGKTDKVTVCHRPPGNPGNAHTIEVGGEAHLAHLAHGDELGECVESADAAPTKQEQQRDAFCERKGGDHPRCEDETEADAQSLSVTEDDGEAAAEVESADDDDQSKPGNGRGADKSKNKNKPSHAGGPGAEQD